MSDGTEPIELDEILYRRIHGSMHPRAGKVGPSPNAFTPNRNDTDGLSLSRASFGTPEQEAARGKRGVAYYVARLSHSVFIEMGLGVVPAPTADDLGHVVVPEMHSGNIKEKVTKERALKLSQSCVSIEGPFLGTREA